MNGMRRFLGGGASTTPLIIPTKSPSSSPSPTKDIPTTPGLFIRKDRKTPATPVAGPSSPPRKSPPDTDSEWTYLGSNGNGSTNGSGSTRGSGLAHTRDALLMSLLSSEAVVDSRGYEILSAEEVEELKKEHVVLTSRLTALERKLTTELKIRDAALTLAKLNSPTAMSPSSPTASPRLKSGRISRQTTDEVAAANRRVDAAQREVWRVKERACEVARRLTEHRAGVLGAVVMENERKGAGEDAEADAEVDMLSPVSSVSGGLTLGSARFDGAHLFAGNEGAIVPGSRRGKASRKEIEALEEQLRAKDDELRLKDEELEGIRGLVKDLESEKEVLAMGGERAAELEGQVQELERELERLEMERRALAAGREEMFEVQGRVRELESELEAMERERDGVRREVGRVKSEADAERAAWVLERAAFIAEKSRWEEEKAQFALDRTRWAADSQRWGDERDRWEHEREELQEQSKVDIGQAREGLRMLVQKHDVPIYSRETGLDVLVDALGRHLDNLSANARNAQSTAEEQRKLEDLLASEMEKRSTISQELESAREEVKALKTRSQQRSSGAGSTHSSSFGEPRPSTPLSFATDAASIVALLQPLWVTLPSPETRASKFSSAVRPFRPGGSPTASPTMRQQNLGSPSISEMDVRTLKGLYNPQQDTPQSPNTAAFSVEAFAARVGALIADDRALIERLIRFAQAHDLLKKNAERAQKLAQESNAALETYQRQVRMLEERTNGGAEQIAALRGELQEHEEALERLSSEKLEVETLAAEQAETVRQLTEANATLSARALALADDAAKAQEEVRVMSERDQAQRLALMEEINLVQTENGKMRGQLRALGKM
ncbi:hypothetical protein BV25DRAFT_1821443 [Artomyces pyxidatus]|uniref:Uncharacterized protein n=1 Tax=Artomyces pyxidatus TaxID=48021 RepID=A0ACB8TAZ7_9AGAM|nr:hypothetical protein BV25DRAFT_1821443 [Artomyces pyxidatus]